MRTDDTTAPDPAAAANVATTAILADLADTRHKAVVVDSPPGAGKSTLVIRAAQELNRRRRTPDHRRPDQQPGRRPDRESH